MLNLDLASPLSEKSNLRKEKRNFSSNYKNSIYFRYSDLSVTRRTALARRFAAEGNWVAVLQVTAKIPASQNRLLLLRSVAAIELRDNAEIASVVSVCISQKVDPRIALNIASRLLGDGRFAEAWGILSAMPPDDGRSLISLLKRLALKSDIRSLRMAANRRWSELQGIDLPPEKPTEGNFPGRDPDEPPLPPPYVFPKPIRPSEDSGTGFALTLLNGNRVPKLHESLYRDAMRRFFVAIENRSTPRVVEHKDVFVSRFGQIWKADGTVIQSAGHKLPDDWTARHIEGVDEAVLCTNATRGMYHWYAERLPALAWRLAPGAPTSPILIGSHAAAFQKETFRLLSVPPDQVICIDDIFYCGRVLVSDMTLASLTHWSSFRHVYDRLIASAASEHDGTPHPKSIYISRRDSNRRPLVNEAALEDRMASLGISPMVFSEMPLSAQINAVSNADFVSGPHGAGLTHILGHRAGLRVFEMHPVQNGSHFLRLTMARLSRVRGHNHTMWLEPVNPLTLEWNVDIDGVVRAVELALSNL